MSDLKFMSMKPPTAGADRPCCGEDEATTGNAGSPPWADGTVETKAGRVPRISTGITGRDRWEHIRCRTSAFRDSYAVAPGLYAVGSPDGRSDVLVSANYKLSFDHLRKELAGMDLWVLVLDTRGINVWCAAGKGTFGTGELRRRIAAVQLDRIVEHRRIILPQLGAPGVKAQEVRKTTGFRVIYGPVHARDIRNFIAAGYKATRQMRTIGFGITDRLVLTPMEINPAMKKYYPFYGLFVLVVFGLQPNGIIFKEAWQGGLPFLLLGLVSVCAGAFLTPLLLPFIPFRSFAVKGWILGMASTLVAMVSTSMFESKTFFLNIASVVFFPLASSYVALQFTGSTTFTGMSGVKKELRRSVPLYVLAAVVSAATLVAARLREWGLL